MNPHVTLLIGRCLIAALFIGGAVQKAVDPAQVMAMLGAKGLPQAMIWPALAFNLVTGIGLLLGTGVRPISYALAAYCALTSLFHVIPTDPWQMSIFVKNWAIAGGCLCLGVVGSGRLALWPDTNFTFAPPAR